MSVSARVDDRLLYGIAQANWNKGLASEAAEAMIRYGFEELKFERIEASTDAANLASLRVMERAGMNFWKREPTNGLDTVYNAISREAFFRRATHAAGGTVRFVRGIGRTVK